MKRLTAILLTSIYMLASVGVSVNVHYCGGKIANVKLFAAANCCCDDEKEENGCCHDESFLFQIEDDQRLAAQNFEFHSLVGAVEVMRPALAHKAMPDLKGNINPAFLDLPPPPEIPLRLQYCSLTYYG